MEERLCRRCVYWDALGVDRGEAGLGYCRRRAPGRDWDDIEGGRGWSKWPPTLPKDWCGEFVAEKGGGG